jgi:hypothetical protein
MILEEKKNQQLSHGRFSTFIMEQSPPALKLISHSLTIDLGKASIEQCAEL